MNWRIKSELWQKRKHFWNVSRATKIKSQFSFSDSLEMCFSNAFDQLKNSDIALKEETTSPRTATPVHKNMKAPSRLTLNRSSSDNTQKSNESNKIMNMLKKMDSNHKKEKEKLVQELNKLSMRLQQMYVDNRAVGATERLRTSSFAQIKTQEAVKKVIIDH